MITREVWEKWGPWFAPTTIMLALAIVSRMESCTTAKAGEAAYAELNRARISAVEKRVDGIDNWIEEHKGVASARIAQLDSLDRDNAVTREAIVSIKLSLTLIEQDVRELRMMRGLPPGRTRP